MAAMENKWLPINQFFTDEFPFLLVGETIALTAFGISWLIKGAVFMRDH
jgi:hypothetical protein